MNTHRLKTYFALTMAILVTMLLLLKSTAVLLATTTVEANSGDATLTLTNNFMVPEGVTQPQASFEFSYTKDGIVTGDSAYNSTATTDSTQPDLSALDDGSVSFESGLTKTGTTDGKDVYTGTIENILPQGSDFSHAGEYVYTVTEDADTNTNLDDDMTYSQAEFKVHVFVKNSTDGLLVSGASVYQTKDDEGNDGSNAKVSLDENSLVTGTGNDFSFSNMYQTLDENLSISKSVLGDFADKSKEFEISITLTNPVNVDTSEYKAVIADASSMKPVAATTYTFVPGTSQSVDLKDGEILVFISSDATPKTDTALTDADKNCMPSGLTYVIEESAATDYSPKATVTHGGTSDSELSGKEGETFTVDTNTLVDTGNNGTALKSEYHTVAVTGYIVRLIPAILLIAISIIAIVLNMNSNRKRDAEE